MFLTLQLFDDDGSYLATLRKSNADYAPSIIRWEGCYFLGGHSKEDGEYLEVHYRHKSFEDFGNASDSMNDIDKELVASAEAAFLGYDRAEDKAND